MERVNASPPIVAVTPDDDTVYSPPIVGLRVGTTAGDIAVMSAGQLVVITGVQIGETVPGTFNKVMATGTTAAGINGWRWDELVQ